MVRGRIDVLVPAPGGAMVVDYKTDAVSAEAVAVPGRGVRATRCGQYRDAVERITGIAPRGGCCIVFLTARVDGSRIRVANGARRDRLYAVASRGGRAYRSSAGVRADAAHRKWVSCLNRRTSTGMMSDAASANRIPASRRAVRTVRSRPARTPTAPPRAEQDPTSASSPIDLDGTLLNDSKQVSDQTAEALRVPARARREGR